jgi:hypothetical protein
MFDSCVIQCFALVNISWTYAVKQALTRAIPVWEGDQARSHNVSVCLFPAHHIPKSSSGSVIPFGHYRFRYPKIGGQEEAVESRECRLQFAGADNYLARGPEEDGVSCILESNVGWRGRDRWTYTDSQIEIFSCIDL